MGRRNLSGYCPEWWKRYEEKEARKMSLGRFGRRSGFRGGFYDAHSEVNRLIDEMPGVKPEDIDIAVHDRVLTIYGEREVDEEEERAGYYIRELRHGSFRRSMLLAEDVDEEKIHARYQDGILEVILEGAAAVREPKRIQIEGSDS